MARPTHYCSFILHVICILLIKASAERCSEEEKQELLASLNYFRCLHGSPAISWNDPVAEGGEAFVRDLTQMRHHDNSFGILPPQGPAAENLMAGTSNVETITKFWYDEVKLCDWNAHCEGNTGQTGHFTAMIWRGVRSMGCGWNDFRKRGYTPILICRYWAGDTLSADTPNMRSPGSYERNIKPADDSKEGDCKRHLEEDFKAATPGKDESVYTPPEDPLSDPANTNHAPNPPQQTIPWTGDHSVVSTHKDTIVLGPGSTVVGKSGPNGASQSVPSTATLWKPPTQKITDPEWLRPCPEDQPSPGNPDVRCCADVYGKKQCVM